MHRLGVGDRCINRCISWGQVIGALIKHYNEVVVSFQSDFGSTEVHCNESYFVSVQFLK